MSRVSLLPVSANFLRTYTSLFAYYGTGFPSPRPADHLQRNLTHKCLLQVVLLCKVRSLCISQENQGGFEQMLELSINYRISCWQTVLLLVPY